MLYYYNEHKRHQGTMHTYTFTQYLIMVEELDLNKRYQDTVHTYTFTQHLIMLEELDLNKR